MLEDHFVALFKDFRKIHQSEAAVKQQADQRLAMFYSKEPLPSLFCKPCQKEQHGNTFAEENVQCMQENLITIF